ncbi:MAG: hypothetical protein ACREQN_08575 [Candidatus Binataceae bacterium]
MPARCSADNPPRYAPIRWNEYALEFAAWTDAHMANETGKTVAANGREARGPSVDADGEALRIKR